MGNLGKKIIRYWAIKCNCRSCRLLFYKKRRKPDLQEEFADFQDNLKETAASAVNVASNLK